MPVQRKKLAVVGFALVGLVSLVAAVLPVIKGQRLDVTLLCVGLFWLILSAVAGRRSGGGNA